MFGGAHTTLVDRDHGTAGFIFLSEINMYFVFQRSFPNLGAYLCSPPRKETEQQQEMLRRELPVKITPKFK